jgi:hypothetical protein
MIYISIDNDYHASLAVSLIEEYNVDIGNTTFISHAPLLASPLFGFNHWG